MGIFYVSPSGKDDDEGGLEKPFRTVQRGVDALSNAGDILYLRHGTYQEQVEILNKEGSASAPIVIRS